MSERTIEQALACLLLIEERRLREEWPAMAAVARRHADALETYPTEPECEHGYTGGCSECREADGLTSHEGYGR